MTLTAIKIQVEDKSNKIENDIYTKFFKFATEPSSFLTNCICSWEISDGKLFITEINCHYEFDENERVKEVDFTTVKLEKVYLEDIIESDEKVNLKWDFIEIVFPNKLLTEYYDDWEFDSIQINFKDGKVSQTSRIRIFPEFDDDAPF